MFLKRDAPNTMKSILEKRLILHWNHVSKMTSKSSNMTNFSSRVQFLVMKWRTYCSSYAPMLCCSKYHNTLAYLIDAMIRLTFLMQIITQCFWRSWPGCSKLTTSLVNVSLKFQTSISEISQYILLKKCKTLWQCKIFSHFSTKNISVSAYKVIQHLMS